MGLSSLHSPGVSCSSLLPFEEGKHHTPLSAGAPFACGDGADVFAALEGMKGQGRSAKASSTEKRNLDMLLQEGEAASCALPGLPAIRLKAYQEKGRLGMPLTASAPQ